AGWWKQLAPWRPQSLWIGSLVLERVEALCSIEHAEPLAPLDNLLLTNLSARQMTDGAALVRRLGIGEVLLNRLLGRLERHGIVGKDSSHWQLTDAGAAAQQSKLLPGQRHERRAFWFIGDLLDNSHTEFVALSNPGALQPAEASRLHSGSLEGLLRC